MAYLLTELPYLGKSMQFFSWKFDKEMKYAIGFSAVFTRKKVLTENVLKILKWFYDFWPPCMV